MNSKVVTVRLPDEILSRMDAAGENRSAIIIQALNHYLPKKAKAREIESGTAARLAAVRTPVLRPGGCPECGAVGGVHQRNCRRK